MDNDRRDHHAETFACVLAEVGIRAWTPKRPKRQLRGEPPRFPHREQRSGSVSYTGLISAAEGRACAAVDVAAGLGSVAPTRAVSVLIPRLLVE